MYSLIEGLYGCLWITSFTLNYNGHRGDIYDHIISLLDASSIHGLSSATCYQVVTYHVPIKKIFSVAKNKNVWVFCWCLIQLANDWRNTKRICPSASWRDDTNAKSWFGNTEIIVCVANMWLRHVRVHTYITCMIRVG